MSLTKEEKEKIVEDALTSVRHYKHKAGKAFSQKCYVHYDDLELIEALLRFCLTVHCMGDSDDT